MEGLLVVLTLFFLASPVIAIIALVKVSNLRRDLETLRHDFRLSQTVSQTITPRVKSSTSQAKPQVKPPVSQSHDKTETARAALKQRPAETVKARSLPKPPPADMASKPLKKANVQKPVKHKVTPKKPKASLEERIGSQWSVWVGGLALAVGAIFLLRFSIESGVFTPTLRLALAAVLGIAALGGGELLRRRDKGLAGHDINENAPIYQQAYIPGILTAVGLFTLLGVVYAAHAIYAFIGPAPAFAMLGAISLMGLGLGLLHGPKMAAFGLIAALVTPLFINSSLPNYAALYGYLLLIGSAALLLAQKRRWTGLSVMALFGLLLWALLSQKALDVTGTGVLWIGYSVLSYLASLWTAYDHSAKAKASSAKTNLNFQTFGPAVSTIWTAFLAVIVISALMEKATGIAILAGLCLAALFMAAGGWKPRFNMQALIGGGLASVIALWSNISLGQSIIIAGAVSLLMWALYFRQSRETQDNHVLSLKPFIWAGLSAAAPLGLWALMPLERGVGSAVKTTWLQISALGPLEGLAYIGLAIIFGATAEYLWREQSAQRDVKNLSLNIYVVGAGAALALGLLYCLNIDVKFYASLLGAALALGAYQIRPVWSLRPLIAGALCLATFFAVLHHIQGGDVGTRYVFNALWIFLAAPAGLSVAAALSLSLKDEDLWSEGLKALALSLAALFAVMQIHHMMNNGRVLATSFSLEEAALFVLTGLCFTFGSAWMERNITSPLRSRPYHKQILPWVSIGFSVLTIGGFILFICIAENPLLNDRVNVKGRWGLNTLLLAYLLPAILMGATAVWSRRSRPELYVRAMGGLGFLSFMIYLTASVRHMFSAESLSVITHPPSGGELYAISAAWLFVGMGLLVLGLKTRRQDVRIISGVIIILTVLKAFLIDMASLEGVLRAMSFVILGLVLIVIGRVYQKLIFKSQPRLDASEGES